jgi:hypothetical protein
MVFPLNSHHFVPIIPDVIEMFRYQIQATGFSTEKEECAKTRVVKRDFSVFE